MRRLAVAGGRAPIPSGLEASTRMRPSLPSEAFMSLHERRDDFRSRRLGGLAGDLLLRLRRRPIGHRRIQHRGFLPPHLRNGRRHCTLEEWYRQVRYRIRWTRSWRDEMRRHPRRPRASVTESPSPTAASPTAAHQGLDQIGAVAGRCPNGDTPAWNDWIGVAARTATKEVRVGRGDYSSTARTHASGGRRST